MNFRKLRETKEYHAQRSLYLEAMCFLNGKVYCLESGTGKRELCVYNIIPESTNLTLLDSVTLDERIHRQLHADSYSRSVYVPADGGVGIFRLKDNRLVNIRNLICVTNAASVAVSSRDTAIVCDEDTKTVCKVNVSTDTVIGRLQAPEQVTKRGLLPAMVAVLGKTALVCYVSDFRARYFANPTFVLLHTDNSATPGHVLETPAANGMLTNINTDGHSSFLLPWGGFVHVLDERGNLRYKITTARLGGIWDCAVVSSQLWIGFYRGSIAVMSSE